MSGDNEDLLDKMERIAEEVNTDDEFDASSTEEATFEGSDSIGIGSSAPDTDDSDLTGLYFDRRESLGTESSSLYTSNLDETESSSPYETGDGTDEEGVHDMSGPVEYQWANTGEASFDEAGGPYARRSSFTAPRRSSFASSGGTSSADSYEDGFRPDIRRTQSTRYTARRRGSVKFAPSPFHSDGEVKEPPSSTSRKKNLRQPFSHRFTFRGPSTSNLASSRAFSARRNSSKENQDTTFSSLGQMGHSDFDNVAAAAAVVALGAGPHSNKRIQYAVGDTVLVFLNIMNHTNSVDPPEAFTVAPVNKHGFPSGEGKSHAEQQGPFVYVMATVKRVHFDEDVPYYTVIREDTGADQRADVAWMEPLTAMRGIEAATRAAHQTGQSADDLDRSHVSAGGSLGCLANCLLMPVRFAKNRLVPWYRRARAATKEQVALILYGDSPFYCRFRVTGINLLVICSFIYMFIEVVNLAFLPASSDFTVVVIGVIVWSILALELIFEWLIRPSDYFQLITSDKAYAPSTARHINGFHLVFEAIALALFIPEFSCLSSKQCGRRVPFSGVDAALSAVLGPSRSRAAYGRLCIGLTSLRVIGLVRHWKTMWINRTFSENGVESKLLFMRIEDFLDDEPSQRGSLKNSKAKIEHEKVDAEKESKPSDEEDQRLKKAATIGTALMVVNSHRALILLVTIATVMPIIKGMLRVNDVAKNDVDLLQQNNLMLSEANETSCEFLKTTIDQWLYLGDVSTDTRFRDKETQPSVLWAQLLPVRCGFQRSDGVITICPQYAALDEKLMICKIWDDRPADPDDATPSYYSNLLGVRVGGITQYQEVQNETLRFGSESSAGSEEVFSVRVLVDENQTISFTFFAEFLLLGTILTLCLLGLTVLRKDAGQLVLGPLQRMLKIVVRYAKNPLSQTVQRKKRKHKRGSSNDTGNNELTDAEKDSDNAELGNYETEQLINAIAKIADLLRKCWGVAGAGIISSNLARTEEGKTVVFNPTVPGKRVYALFGFVAIDGFSEQLVALDRDVMILINDVAKVVHDEVYRWAMGDSGQCNKNLGNSFLMVFRIGDFNEVHERKARATDVVFSSEKRTSKSKALRRRGRGVHSKGRMAKAARGYSRLDAGTDDTLQLASLPGIQSFSDRALLGFLKSFAGIYRDKHLQNWKRDFRLGAGVGAFTVNIIMGMDAGWAVEGAVGSEYKIDATYLSPHVNMASRMMSAAKQYGVTILLSQAVEELLSAPARSKLRHLDTVYVKGSSVAQRIFTYDARHQGVDFFLLERSPEQADVDAESYTPSIWDTDPDLRAMRQHVTSPFEKKFKEGVGRYLSGNWESAIAALQAADDIMITTVLEEGYIDYNPDEEIDERIFDRQNTDDEILRLRDLGDGACKCLINYMERRGGVPPARWSGVRPLTSK